MKVFLNTIFIFIFLGLVSSLSADIGRQEVSTYFNIKSSTSTPSSFNVEVSSTAVTTICFSNQQNGIQREITVEDDTYGVKCLIGNSATLVLSNGKYLLPRSWSLINSSMEDIRLQGLPGNPAVKVHIRILEKQ